MTASAAMDLQAKIAALRAHPSFAQASRALAIGLTGFYRGGPLLNWLMDDRARVVLSHVVLHSHFARDPADPSSGLTPTRMKQLCSEFDLCSPGRATAMLSLMRFAGYLAPDPDADDRRRRPLVATPKLLDLLRPRWRSHFRSGVPVFPDGAVLAERLDDPVFVRAFLAAMFGRYKDGFRLIMYTPGLGLFGDRSAGMMIASTFLAAGAEDDTVPPSRPFAISISELSRRFGVSRAHVAKMLRDAAHDGLIMRAGDKGEEITLAPALAEALSVFYANAFIFFFDSAREAAATLDGDDRNIGERRQRSV
ncbi:hypothetical protein KMZ68_17070 [Bradyrhizobium sediminis]|uniref:Uncharacterized protein n=1 Tax=Bradyrhizobium sediminis TaxID=2840469 RepID=A0A975NLH3_9BRAD|nr:hypothetical protein [Bradyrhizobium sediminis]QWG16701.1 hypothetical protein KMZ68_17070 [Bradyrhizobium sediminis]